MNNTSRLAFMARLTVLYNGFYILTTAFLYFRRHEISNNLTNYITVLGLEIAPFVNMLFVSWFLINLIAKKSNTIPKWQTIFNFSMLLVQAALLFI
ncbi:MAG: hypothetical protein RLZ16_1015 [Bacteroidota bacterium]